MGVGPHSQLLHSHSEESTASADCPLPLEGDSAGICPPSSCQRQTETEGDDEKVEEREEGMRRPPKPPAKDPPKLVPDPFPVAEFGSHVERNHTNNNQPFVTEFEVQILHKMHTSAIWCCLLCRHWAMGKESRSQWQGVWRTGKRIVLQTSLHVSLSQLTRAIRCVLWCADDDSRVILNALDDLTDNYINASYVDVSINVEHSMELHPLLSIIIQGHSMSKKLIATQGTVCTLVFRVQFHI